MPEENKYHFRLPFLPPSVNSLYRANFVKGRAVIHKTNEVHQFERDARLLLRRPPSPLPGWLGIKILFIVPQRFATKDGDNLLKVLIDTLVDAGVIANDGHICRYEVEKRPGDTEGVTGLVYSLDDPTLPAFPAAKAD